MQPVVARSLALAVLLLLAPLAIHAQVKVANDQGAFVLHKFAKSIGKETYTIT